MKNTFIYLIIAAIVIYLIYRWRKNNKTNKTGNQTQPTYEGGGGGGGGYSGQEPGSSANTTPLTPQGSLAHETVTVEKCPFCGTPNVHVRRYYWGDKLLRVSVNDCPNKSCPSQKTKTLIIAQNKNTVDKNQSSR